jgi:hypothetical protein
MALAKDGSSLLLALPRPCLLAVLQCLAADDQRSFFCAARAHSRLHQAAVLALRSITAVVTQQQQADSVLLYLSKHGQHVDSVSIEYTGDDGECAFCFSHFPYPDAMQLRSWLVSNMVLGGGLQQVLGPALTQLQLIECRMFDDAAIHALNAALSQLPDLQHLSLRGLGTGEDFTECYEFPTCVLQQLQQLTYLELEAIGYWGTDSNRPILQPLQA